MRRVPILAIVLGAVAVLLPFAGAQPPVPTPQAPLTLPSSPFEVESDPLDHWLEDVRAQRRAWEERRRAQKDAMDARRRWIDPRGAAQQEAREQEVNRRREELRDRVERSREAFLQQGPWAPPGPPGEDQFGPPAEEHDPAARFPETRPPLVEPYPPLPGWDNRWYYRGY